MASCCCLACWRSRVFFVHLDEGLKGCERKAIVIEDLMSLSKKDVKCSLRQYEHSAA